MSEKGIRDARTLGVPKMLLLGFQHMFAMFGATVLVPALTGLSVSATLLFAGLGTLLFHFLAKGKVPAFLGSSFAFIGGYAAVHAMFENTEGMNWIPYAGVGVISAALIYLILSALFKAFGAGKVMRFFPPIVTGPVKMCIRDRSYTALRIFWKTGRSPSRCSGRNTNRIWNLCAASAGRPRPPRRCPMRTSSICSTWASRATCATSSWSMWTAVPSRP